MTTFHPAIANDLVNMDDDSLAAAVSTLAAHIHAATYRLLVLIVELDRREVWAAAEPLAALEGALDRLIDLAEPFATGQRAPGPLAEPWEELISARTTASADCAAFTAEVAQRAAPGTRVATARRKTTPPSTRRERACMTWRSAAGT